MLMTDARLAHRVYAALIKVQVPGLNTFLRRATVQSYADIGRAVEPALEEAKREDLEALRAAGVTQCLRWGPPTFGNGFTVELYQNGPDDFRVTYGLQVRDSLTYAKAAAELGSCIMHSLACDGLLDNREPGDDA